MTEATGIPVGLAVAGANRPDMKLVYQTLDSVPPSLEETRWKLLETGEWEQGLCLDAGYDYAFVPALVDEFGYTPHIRSRREENLVRKAGQRARRWVVERTHSWMNRYRRILVRWEKKADNYLALLHFACAIMTWNKCLFG